jgi:hypothetical protein
MLQVFFLVVIPLALIILMNLCIVVKIKTRRFQRTTLGGTVNKQQGTGDQMAMTMIIIVTVIFIIASMPYAIHVFYWDFALASTTLTASQVQQFNVSHTVAQFSFRIQINMHFFVFVVACKRFRDDLLRTIFCCCFKRPTTNNCA